jgi:hypothetical protein
MNKDDYGKMGTDGKLADMAKHLSEDDYKKMAEGGKMDDLAVQMSEDDYKKMADGGKLVDMAGHLDQDAYKKMKAKGNLGNMAENMKQDDMVKLGDDGKLGEMTAFMQSNEIEKLDTSVQVGILKGLGKSLFSTAPTETQSTLTNAENREAAKKEISETQVSFDAMLQKQQQTISAETPTIAFEATDANTSESLIEGPKQAAATSVVGSLFNFN